MEGITDKKILLPLLSKKSIRLKKALDEKELVIHPISGTDHVELHLSMARTMVSDYYVFFDNDQAGRTAVKNCTAKSLLEAKDYLLAKYTDMCKDSEIEDMLDVELYRKTINGKYGVDINIGEFKAKNRKWSERIRIVFDKSAKMIDDNILDEVKLSVSSLVKDNVSKALRREGDELLQKLIHNLESRL